MAKQKLFLYPASQREMAALGGRLRDARLRRRFSMDTVCARAGISRTTLTNIENGAPSVSIGNYVQVLRVLQLVGDLADVAAADPVGRKVQDEQLRRRAPRRSCKPA